MAMLVLAATCLRTLPSPVSCWLSTKCTAANTRSKKQRDVDKTKIVWRHYGWDLCVHCSDLGKPNAKFAKIQRIHHRYHKPWTPTFLPPCRKDTMVASWWVVIWYGHMVVGCHGSETRMSCASFEVSLDIKTCQVRKHGCMHTASFILCIRIPVSCCSACPASCTSHISGLRLLAVALHLWEEGFGFEKGKPEG